MAAANLIRSIRRLASSPCRHSLPGLRFQGAGGGAVGTAGAGPGSLSDWTPLTRGPLPAVAQRRNLARQAHVRSAEHAFDAARRAIFDARRRASHQTCGASWALRGRSWPTDGVLRLGALPAAGACGGSKSPCRGPGCARSTKGAFRRSTLATPQREGVHRAGDRRGHRREERAGCR